MLPAFRSGCCRSMSPCASLRLVARSLTRRSGRYARLRAATALTHGLIVATRNGTDFQPTGVETFDPWTFEVPSANRHSLHCFIPSQTVEPEDTR